MYIDASTATCDCDMKADAAVKKQTENTDTLRERHVHKLFYQSGNYMYTRTNKPSFGDKLIPPADSPNHTHSLHPIPLLWPPPETTTNKNNKRWSCAREHKYGK